MRILQVPHAYWPVLGGAERHAQRLTEELAAKGHSIKVFTTDVGSVNGYHDFKVAKIPARKSVVNGIEITRVRWGSSYVRAAAHYLKFIPWERARIVSIGRVWKSFADNFVNQLEREIKRYKPDVMMAMPHLLPNVVAAIAVKERSGTPLVLVPLLHEEVPRLERSHMMSALQHADAVVANTNVERRRLIDEYDVKSENVFTGWLGVDMPLRTLDVAKGREQRVLFLGRQAKSKNIGSLISAMGKVWENHPGCELVIAGAADTATEQLLKIIREMPKHQGNRVQFLCDITESEKMDLLLTSCCLVLPSSSESFGIVILEAWSCATPVIVWDLPVFRDIVDQRKNGILVSQSARSGLSDAIMEMIGSQEKSRKMGLAGFEKAKEQFQWSRVAEVYQEAYRQAVVNASEFGLSSNLGHLS